MTRTLQNVFFVLLCIFVVSCTPRPTPPPGWEIVETENFEIWLPESYEVLDFTSGDMLEIGEWISSLGPEYEVFSQNVLQDPGIIKLMASNMSGADGFLIVGSLEMPPRANFTLEDLVEMAQSQITPSMQLLESEVFTHNNHDAAKLVMELELEEGFVLKELEFILMAKDFIWIVVFGASPEEYQQLLPEFEQSLQSFRLK